MTASIHTLVDDIYKLFGSDNLPHEANIKALGEAISVHVANAFKKPTRVKGQLRGSRIGSSCDRKQWYDTNEPEDTEAYDAHVMLKFLYGNILEEILLFLAEEAGHSVKYRQATVTVDGVEGHIDGVIDGILTDVKSANSRGVHKFQNHGLYEDDPFGYLPQIEFYREGLMDVEDNEIQRDQYAFLAIDKESGKLYLDTYTAHGGTSRSTRERVARNKAVVGSADPPNRSHMPVVDGSSGNLALATACKYCSHKIKCWSHANDGAGLRAFKYSNSVKYLTRVVKTPLVEEINLKEPAVEAIDGS